MTTDFVANAIDLDAIFAPYVSGTKAATTNFIVGGQDLKDRFQKYVSGPKADITYFVDGVGDLKDVFAPLGFDELALTIDPSPINGYNPSDGPGTVDAGGEAMPTGGTGPYTYAWVRLTGSTAITIDDATSKTPTWTFTSSSLAAIRHATWRCTVTDSLMATAYADVEITLQVGGEPP